MEKSNYENIGNAQLFFLIKLFLENLGENYLYEEINIRDNDTFNALREASTAVGVECEFPIDINYIISTINLNKGYDFETRTPSGKLERPQASLYSFDYDEHRTEYIRRTYRHEITSYNDDIVLDTIMALDDEGFDYYDGREVDYDTYDGETTDSGLDTDSIRKIK